MVVYNKQLLSGLHFNSLMYQIHPTCAMETVQQ